MILLDTAAIIFWTTDAANLSPAAREAIETADRRVISSISIWEIALKVKQGRLTMPTPVEQFAERLEQVPDLEILPVDIWTWLDSVRLDWDHRDPVDRTIVALASRLRCPLVTSDRTIAGYYRETLW